MHLKKYWSKSFDRLWILKDLILTIAASPAPLTIINYNYVVVKPLGLAELVRNLKKSCQTGNLQWLISSQLKHKISENEEHTGGDLYF